MGVMSIGWRGHATVGGRSDVRDGLLDSRVITRESDLPRGPHHGGRWLKATYFALGHGEALAAGFGRAHVASPAASAVPLKVSGMGRRLADFLTRTMDAVESRRLCS